MSTSKKSSTNPSIEGESPDRKRKRMEASQSSDRSSMQSSSLGVMSGFGIPSPSSESMPSFPPPIGSSTPHGKEDVSSSVQGTSGYSAPYTPVAMDPFSEATLDNLAAYHANHLAQVQAMLAQKKARREAEQGKKEITVMIYKDNRFPNPPYDVNTAEYSAMPELDKISLYLVNMSYHTEKFAESFAGAFSLFSDMKASKAKMEAADTVPKSAVGGEAQEGTSGEKEASSSHLSGSVSRSDE